MGRSARSGGSRAAAPVIRRRAAEQASGDGALLSDLKSALAGVLAAGALPPGKPPPADRAEPPEAQLPDPLKSAWGELLRVHRVEIPKDPSLGQLTQRSDVRSRELAAQGRKREGDLLRGAKEEYLRLREREAWSLVKARFAALDLPEKAYRALKQEDALPEKVLARLRGRKGEELRGAGAARVRDALLEPG